MFLLIVTQTLHVVMIIVGIVAAAVFAFLFYRLFIHPALQLKADQESPPPEAGYTLDIILEDPTRFRTIAVGCLDGDIKLRLNGIKEDQLVLKFKKERDLEEYEITVVPGANIFYRAPHAQKIEPLKSSEIFESRELIGHPALFRVAAHVKNNRPLQYVEFELSTQYFINNIGEEKMKFPLTMKRIFPGVDVNSRNKKGLYVFGRFQVEHSDQEEEAAAEAEA